MKPNALTVIVPVVPGKLDELRSFLTNLGANVGNNPTIDFTKSPSTHFARWVILDQTCETPARLFFSTCYDGDTTNYFKELSTNFGDEMEAVWTCCQSYQAGWAKDPCSFAKFLQPFSYPVDTFLIAFPSLTARQIVANAALRERVEDMLDQVPAGSDFPLGDQDQNLNPSVPKEGFSTPEWVWRIVDFLVGVDPSAKPQNTVLSTSSDLIDMEDRVVQNQMTIVSAVKKGWWPRLMMKFFLWIGSKAQATPDGKLSGLTTIHFARWVLIDNGDNLLFESNYDGSWERYIDDFGDNAVGGMNSVWGNCTGFPKGGCLDIEAFKQVIRSHQIQAQFFYSAYPNSTIQNINSDRTLKTSLSQLDGYLAGIYD